MKEARAVLCIVLPLFAAVGYVFGFVVHGILCGAQRAKEDVDQIVDEYLG